MIRWGAAQGLHRGFFGGSVWLVKLPVVNIDEKIGKSVGKVAPADYDSLVAAAEAIMPRLPFPKGVYRFRSFEEADAWTEHHILEAARKKNEGEAATSSRLVMGSDY